MLLSKMILPRKLLVLPWNTPPFTSCCRYMYSRVEHQRARANFREDAPAHNPIQRQGHAVVDLKDAARTRQGDVARAGKTPRRPQGAIVI